MKIRVLGSGTSSGVPVPGCRCAVCTSSDPRNQRLRTSIFIELRARDADSPLGDSSELIEDAEHVTGHILVDTSPDLRQQALRENIARVDSVLYTHVHADHIFGIDDLRSFNFVNNSSIDCYASDASAEELELRFNYAFFPDPRYQGGSPPRLRLHRITPYKPFVLFGTTILPLTLLHGTMEVLGFRVKNFAYLTDCSFIPEQSIELLRGLDVLIIDGLRTRPHATHFTHAQAVEQIERLRPAQSFLTHLSHEIDHHTANVALAAMTSLPVELAYDGLVLEL